MNTDNESSIALAIVILFTLLFAHQSEATTATIRTPVMGVLTGDRYGGCMVQIGEIPASVLDCPERWVTLDCKGLFGSMTSGHNRLNTARTAMLTDSRISVQVDDSRKVSGFCFAPQIIIFKE